MADTTPTVSDLLGAIINRDPIEFQEMATAILAQKQLDAIDAMRYEIATSLYSEESETIAEEETDDEDFDDLEDNDEDLEEELDLDDDEDFEDFDDILDDLDEEIDLDDLDDEEYSLVDDEDFEDDDQDA